MKLQKFGVDSNHEPKCLETIKHKTPYYECVDEIYSGHTISRATVFLDKIPTEILAEELSKRVGVRANRYLNGRIYALDLREALHPNQRKQEN